MDRRISEISDDMARIDGIVCIMTYFGFKVVQSTTAQTSPAMQIPMALIYAAFPTGRALMIMEQLLTFIERLKNKNAPEEPREFID